MSDNDNTAIKVLDADRGILGGWAIPFGGPVHGGKDLEGEYFAPDTNFAFDWFPDEGRPVLYEHGTDPAIKLTVIGRQTSKRVDPDKGVWAQTQLNMAHRYAEVILQLAKKGVLGYSSGSVLAHIRRSGAGKIAQWPWIELTLTPRPANPYGLIAPEAVKHIEVIGNEVPGQLLVGDDVMSGYEKRIADLEAAVAALKGPARSDQQNGKDAAEGLSELQAALAAAKEGA